jgi:transcriptional regulator with XRE-family HTH domain
VGVSQQQIAKLERSAVNPTVETLEKVAAAFGMRVAVGFEPAFSHT